MGTFAALFYKAGAGIPEPYGNPEVQAAVKSIIERFSDKEVMDY